MPVVEFANTLRLIYGLPDFMIRIPDKVFFASFILNLWIPFLAMLVKPIVLIPLI